MNSKDLYNAIGKVDDDILEQSEAIQKENRMVEVGSYGGVSLLGRRGLSLAQRPPSRSNGNREPGGSDSILRWKSVGRTTVSSRR